MCKLMRFWFFIYLTIFGNHLFEKLVESKAHLCLPPPKWTVNNGTDPMAESLGNVTLVALINASYRFGLKQASGLDHILKFLRKSGLKDFTFIVINSKDFESKQNFKELSGKVSFDIYQENEEELVWNVLDGGKDDIFLYDRCGLLTYYIPFPLSIIHSQQPILQAALLSTYFDNPCGESCDSVRSDTNLITTTESPSNASAETTLNPRLNLSENVVNMTFDSSLSQDFNETKDNETTDLRDENVFETSLNTNHSIFTDDLNGSGSGDLSIEDLSEISTESVNLFNNQNISLNNFKEEDEWKGLNFFRTNDNRSDKDVFEEIFNKSVIQLEAIANTTIYSIRNFNENITNEGIGVNESLSTRSPIRLSILKPNRFSFFNSTRTKCETFNQSMCTEWSTDRLLKARLCCLSEVMADDDSGFGCGPFEKGKCNRMLPLIKCCLKDFSQLLDNYFRTIKANPRPSRQRFRN